MLNEFEYALAEAAFLQILGPWKYIEEDIETFDGKKYKMTGWKRIGRDIDKIYEEAIDFLARRILYRDTIFLL